MLSSDSDVTENKESKNKQLEGNAQKDKAVEVYEEVQVNNDHSKEETLLLNLSLQKKLKRG